MEMIGQYKLKALLEQSVKENTLPQTILLEGPEGCGKHVLTKKLCSMLEQDLIDITDKLDYDTILQIALNPLKCVYVIDCSNITIRQQNVVLKFLEEPPQNSTVVLLCEDRTKLLQTVQNRCYCFKFDPYFDDELCQFLEPFIDQEKRDLILQYADTPGKVIRLSSEPLQDIVNLCVKVFNSIGAANYSNVLTIPNKFYFTEKDKAENNLNFDTFCYVLDMTAVSMYLSAQISYSCYQLTHELYNDTFITNINKKQLFEHYLIELKMLVEGS